ncbi:hypothetical protein DUI87_11539 [Hirundo rustica rustica]|uniref:CST complex subunit STN1 n=1 Tax=Hirundo rustica rustica TaxID=333673 RepID=A0A3M0KK78_HIRRU|nr:hypothetical protein DUI87_11539 [Hirundo rustica rustica]
MDWFWMQSESKKYEEEIPSLHWGIDPVFSAFARLYIKDITEMRESKQVPGIFFYNGHPVRQVDVVGIVVQTKERDAFYNCGEELPFCSLDIILYWKNQHDIGMEISAVDDSTGVINCVCWKNPMVAETPLSGHQSTPSSLSVFEQMKKLQETVSQKTKLEIGDVVRVRGYIRTYRQQREIQASCFYKVDDPVCDVQISRMLELPCLYREVYDKPFKGPEEAQSGLEGQNSPIHMLHVKVQGFLLENKIQTFYQQELETVDSLVSLAGVHLPSPSCQEFMVIACFTPEASELLLVTDHDKELFKVTLDVIKEDCRKPRHQANGRENTNQNHLKSYLIDAEKGCHFLHVLSCVRQSYLPSLAEVVMHRVLELLESNSDVVSTMEGYFMVF